MLNETYAEGLRQISLTHVCGLIVNLGDLTGVLVTTAIFTLFGLIVFGLAYMIIVKTSPFSIRKEIEDDQNTALAIIIGSVIIGVALIIAAAIHG